jgi:hypothetical protein
MNGDEWSWADIGLAAWNLAPILIGGGVIWFMAWVVAVCGGGPK